MNYKEAKVTWIDTTSYNGEWMDVSRLVDFEPEKCHTKGWLVKETSEVVMVAQSISEISGVYNVMVIPKGCITTIKEE